jgi:hypothetical protein
LAYAYVRRPDVIRLHAAQRRIYQERRRYNVVACGRRFGKTILGEYLLKEKLDQPQAWYSPTYKDMLEVWRDVLRLFAADIVRKSTQERRIELRQGGVIEFWSLENPDAGRGRKYARVIVDEAGLIAALLAIWNNTIRATLMDMAGDAWFLGTPKGRNGFWRLHQLGSDPHAEDWASWQMPTSANPFIDPAEVAAARETMAEDAFRQEILAVFLEDGAGVFRHVLEAATAVAIDKPLAGRQYVAGVDVAALVDYTVVAVMDAKTKELVHLDRFNRVDYNVLEERLAALYARFDMAALVVESNSIGQPVIDHLRQRGMIVQPFTTTNATKTAVIQSLQAAFEHREIKIIDDAVLTSELMAYEGEQRSGYWKYGAPEGMHDDTVMALALAWSAVQTTPPSLLAWQPEQESRWAVGDDAPRAGRWRRY